MVDILFRRNLLGDIEESSWLIFYTENNKDEIAKSSCLIFTTEIICMILTRALGPH